MKVYNINMIKIILIIFSLVLLFAGCDLQNNQITPQESSTTQLEETNITPQGNSTTQPAETNITPQGNSTTQPAETNITSQEISEPTPTLTATAQTDISPASTPSISKQAFALLMNKYLPPLDTSLRFVGIAESGHIGTVSKVYSNKDEALYEFAGVYHDGMGTPDKFGVRYYF